MENHENGPVKLTCEEPRSSASKAIFGASINGSYLAILLAFYALALHVPNCCHLKF